MGIGLLAATQHIDAERDEGEFVGLLAVAWAAQDGAVIEVVGAAAGFGVDVV